MKLTASQRKGLIKELSAKFNDKKRIETGIDQAAGLWDLKKDGTFKEFQNFCLTYYVEGETAIAALRDKLEYVFERLNGHLIEVSSAFSRWKDVELGAFTPQDELLSKYNAFKHTEDDFFDIKLVFLVLLNFKQESFQSVMKNYQAWSREKWAETKLSEGFQSRVPAAVSDKVFQASNAADTYINGYNIFVNHTRDAEARQLYPDEKRLISHWGLRDELKGCYADANGKPKQELIYEIMRHIVNGTIPREMINSTKYFWNPVKNKLYQPETGKEAKATPEADRRYSYWFDIFKTTAATDKYYTLNKTYIERRFNVSRKIPEKTVENIFHELLSSPVMAKMTALMKKRLGRDLRPYDIWYPGFDVMPEQATLDAAVAKQYPTIDDFNRKIPEVLKKLGFSEERAAFLHSHILAEPSRSAGHARGASMRGGRALLRIRTEGGKMDYVAFNVAMHELGHTVEQTFSIELIDHTILEGVPNTAFTEAIAFLFQSKDREVLGIPESADKPLKILDSYLSTCEIATMALVDMYSWRYLYRHKNCTPKALKAFVLATVKKLWNKYWAKYLGAADGEILGIYSHMIAYGLYLPDYPMGYIICYQIAKYFENNALAVNLERMCKLGNIYPELWMEQAVGSKISPRLLIDDAAAAADQLLTGR